MSKSYFISFGNGLFRNQLKRISQEAKDTGWFDGVISETPETISEFINEHKEVFSNARGFGFWIWKPYIILRALEKMKEGDFIFYTDAGSRILPHRESRFNEYKNIFLKDQPIWGSGMNQRLRRFCKKSLFTRLGVDNNDEVMDSYMIEGGFVMARKCNESINFMKEWLSLCIEDNYKYLTDDLHTKQFPDFVSHRHDQSIFDCLIKINWYQWFDEDCYGIGPFFHSRLSDEGPRRFAPDWWRAEPDYVRSNHPYIEQWLADKKDPLWWKKSFRYDPNAHFSAEDYVAYMHSIYTNGSRFDPDNVDYKHNRQNKW